MASVECASSGQSAGLKDTSGRLWFATLKGVSVVDPRAVRFDTNPPQVRIESVGFTSMDGAGHDFELPLESGLVLPAGARRLRIHYTGLSFASPHKMPFRYRIEGIDNDWVDAGTDRVATFHDLRPGSFRFQISAANNDGVWNETGASLAFTVQPYYWQTGWFRAGVVFLLISVSGVAASWRAQRRHREELAELERTRKQQAELAHLSRVTMLGELSGSLAHELNQPLGAIMRNAEAAELFLQDPSPDLDEVRAILADIRKDDQRAGEVIDRTRAFMKRREVERRLLDLNLLAGEVATLVRQDAEIRRVRLALETDPALPPVHGDRVQLQQVFLNLLLNAMDALNDNPPTGRRVAVRTRSAGATVEVSVSDNGHGIPADKLPRVFEPFFTTKPSGLGMGLAISRTIITAHGGRITAENNRHGGATFTFTLPVTKPQGGTA
jgi:signal transduction histidine kinase